MPQSIIEVRDLSKLYRLGQLGARSLREEVGRAWSRFRKREQGDVAPLSSAETETNNFWALKEVSFDVKAGEVIGIIGRNGAGKSTLLKILSRITQPTSGEALLRGRVASLLEVGTGFHPELTGRENVFLNGAILGMKKAEIAVKFDEIVAFAEIDRFIDTPVKRYSSGMYVRLAFAVAAHLEPEILIVDEVLAVGDAAFQLKCLGKMQDVAATEGRTILFVSHHMPAIRRLCRTCVVLDKGRCSPVLPMEEAVSHYSRQMPAGLTGLDVDTSNTKRDHGHGGRARINRVRALGELPLVYGKPMHLEFTIKVECAIADAMVGAGFDSMDGARIMTLDSDASGVLLQLEPGVHRIVISLPMLPVHPASYVVHCVIGSGGHYYDSLHRFAVWEVATGALDLVSDRGAGGCRLMPEVAAHKVE